MACPRTQKKRARKRDKEQCQLCGDSSPINYGRLEVHHIDCRCKGGSDELENFVTLCDLCHAVVHEHMGPTWVGLSKFPIEKRDENKIVLNQAREEFEVYLRLPIEERRRIQRELWAEWNIMHMT